MLQRGTRGRIRDALGHGALLVFFLYFFATGIHILHDQHSGIPAQMTVEKCIGSGKALECGGVWRHAGSQNESPVDAKMSISGVGREDIGHDVAVHIHRGRGNSLWWIPDDAHVYAMADKSWAALYMLGVACVLGALEAMMIVRGRRRHIDKAYLGNS